MYKPKEYFLQNAGMGYCGNAPYWWEENNSGYTPNIDQAKKFSFKEAISIIRSCRGSHKFVKWEVQFVLAKVRRVIDVQDLTR